MRRKGSTKMHSATNHIFHSTAPLATIECSLERRSRTSVAGILVGSQGSGIPWTPHLSTLCFALLRLNFGNPLHLSQFSGSWLFELYFIHTSTLRPSSMQKQKSDVLHIPKGETRVGKRLYGEPRMGCHPEYIS